MKLKICVHSVANDTEYGGEQILDCVCGEYQLNDVFRLPFFRIIIDDIIEGALCFRLMEGGIEHYFVLDDGDRFATFRRDTSLGEDNFDFELLS
jgi:hypothetical protein